MTASDVLRFWFEECKPEQWFKKSAAFDEVIRARFGKLHTRAAACELADWRENLEGRLAEIIVLDQFSRNIHRDDARAFAQDPLALALAQEAAKDPAAKNLPAAKRAFLYLPFMHSESLAIHERAVALFAQPGLEGNLDHELQHKKIIERFGRYPHRNKILGRSSTPEEIDFLTKPGSSF